MLTMLTDLTNKVNDLTTQVATLKPLLPLVKQLNALPDKVTKLQAAAFKGSNQVSALNLAISRSGEQRRQEHVHAGAAQNPPQATPRSQTRGRR
ncbi:unnamed protein product [Urochloa humidicola]